MCGRGLTERRALKVVGMSASSLRYRPVPDRNAELRKVLRALAYRHRRYGALPVTSRYLQIMMAMETTIWRFSGRRTTTGTSIAVRMTPHG